MADILKKFNTRQRWFAALTALLVFSMSASALIIFYRSNIDRRISLSSGSPQGALQSLTGTQSIAGERSIVPNSSGVLKIPATSDNLGEQNLVVTARPITSTLTIVGTIVPGETTPITAPFDGVVQSIGFEYGRRVTNGQSLLTMDTSELDGAQRDAQSTYLKAEQAEHEIENWTNGPDVSRARRTVTSGELELKATLHKLEETKALLDRGLVARSEYDALIQQQKTEELALEAAREDLGTALDRGQGINVQVATLGLESAKARLEALLKERAGAVVKSTVSGIIVRPPADKNDAGSNAVHEGTHLAKGQFIGIIAKSDRLGVSFKLNESDANRVHEGQPVTVTGPGFENMIIHGHVSSVAGEATSAGSDGGASFEASALLDVNPSDFAANIRIGMSANVAITLYENPTALVVPPQAVEGGAPFTTVRVREPGRKNTHNVKVTTGAVTPDSVEIRSGLKSGDVVVWGTALIQH